MELTVNHTHHQIPQEAQNKTNSSTPPNLYLHLASTPLLPTPSPKHNLPIPPTRMAYDGVLGPGGGSHPMLARSPSNLVRDQALLDTDLP